MVEAEREAPAAHRRYHRKPERRDGPGTMRITVNGKPESAAEGCTVADLLDRLALQPVRVAVEINEDLVPRRTFAERVLQDGDRVEIVTFVGGG